MSDEDKKQDSQSEIVEVLEGLLEMKDELRSLTVIYDVIDSEDNLATGITGDSKATRDWTFHNAVLTNYINDMLKGDKDERDSDRLNVH